MKHFQKIIRNPIGQIVWGGLSVLIFYVIGKDSIKGYTMGQIIAFTISAFLITFSLHESIHALTYILFSKGKGKVSFGTTKFTGFGFAFVTICDEQLLKRWQLIILNLSPSIILSVIPAIILFFNGKINIVIFFVAIINLCSAYKDIADSILIICKNT